jgi:hypothetical protein
LKQIDPFDAIRAELAKLEARPGIAKACGDRRSQLRSKAHAVFCAGIEHLLLNGWSMRKIADHLDVHPVTLKDWYEQGDRQRSQLPAWASDGLPDEAQPAMIRARLDNVERNGAGRTGTDG